MVSSGPHTPSPHLLSPHPPAQRRDSSSSGGGGRVERARRMSVLSLRRCSETLSRIHASASSLNLPGLTKKSSSKKKSFGILSGESMSGIKYGIAWTVYVLIGSWLFLEFEKETSLQVEEHQHWTRYKELLYTGHDAREELLQLRQQLYSLCPHPYFSHDNSSSNSSSEGGGAEGAAAAELATLTGGNLTEAAAAHCADALTIIRHVTSEPQWTFIDSVYYTMTLVTTIGYGHIYPTTCPGRLFAVLYAMVGVPLTCILMAKNSNILSIKMLQLYERLKLKYNSKSRNSKLLLYLVTWLSLSIGFIVFMFIPSLAFVYIEGWTYDQSLYFTFITLSTIGFGDLIGGYDAEVQYAGLYKLALVTWIMLALGYWVMLLNFLQKALKKKFVPKRIRVQFKAKQLAKQAEFLRQLMTKVREQYEDPHEDEDGTTGGLLTAPRRQSSLEGRRGSMSLMAEGAGALSSDVSSLAAGGRKQSLLRSVSVNDDPGLTGSHRSTQNTICLADLLGADVVVRTPKVQFIRSLMEQSMDTTAAKTAAESKKEEAEATANKGLLAPPGADLPQVQVDEPANTRRMSNREVTLPLKDVLGLVTLVANLENQVEGAPYVEDTSMYSTINSMISMDAKLPLLREAFLNMQAKKRGEASGPSDNNKPNNIKYKPVNLSEETKNRKYQRRGSCLDAFIDNQTKREYMEVRKESRDEDNTDPINDEMDTEEIDIVDDDDDDTDQDGDVILSLEDDDDENQDDLGSSDKEDFSKEDEEAGRAGDYRKLSRQGSGPNNV